MCAPTHTHTQHTQSQHTRARANAHTQEYEMASRAQTNGSRGGPGGLGGVGGNHPHHPCPSCKQPLTLKPTQVCNPYTREGVQGGGYILSVFVIRSRCVRGVQVVYPLHTLNVTHRLPKALLVKIIFAAIYV